MSVEGEVSVVLPRTSVAVKIRSSTGATDTDRHGSSTEPLVVVLFAWIGAEDKYLLKYDAAWRRAAAGRNLVTVRVNAPVWLSFDASLRDIALTSYGQLVLDLGDLLTGHIQGVTAAALLPSHCPLLLHFFSNGGAYAYEALTLHPHEWLRRCAGCVFDSCPVDILPHAVKHVVHNTLGRLGGAAAWNFYNLIQLVKAAGLLAQEQPVTALHASGYFVGDRRALFERRVLESPFSAPELYLYSTADEITDHVFIDRVIEHRRRRGVNIASVCWTDSAHVSHLRLHPQEYLGALHAFLRDALSAAPHPHTSTILSRL